MYVSRNLIQYNVSSIKPQLILVAKTTWLAIIYELFLKEMSKETVTHKHCIFQDRKIHAHFAALTGTKFLLVLIGSRASNFTCRASENVESCNVFVLFYHTDYKRAIGNFVSFSVLNMFGGTDFSLIWFSHIRVVVYVNLILALINWSL